MKRLAHRQMVAKWANDFNAFPMISFYLKMSLYFGSIVTTTFEQTVRFMNLIVLCHLFVFLCTHVVAHAKEFQIDSLVFYQQTKLIATCTRLLEGFPVNNFYQRAGLRVVSFLQAFFTSASSGNFISLLGIRTF